MMDKLGIYFLTFCGLGIFLIYAQADTDSLASAEFFNTDYENLARQLDVLKTGNAFLKQRFGMMQFQLDRQKDLWLDMNKKIDEIMLYLQKVEIRLSMENKEHLSHLSDVINAQNQLVNTKFSAPAVEDKWQILADIKNVLKSHGNLLKNYEEKLENIKNGLNKPTWETQTQTLTENVAKNLAALQDIEKKVAKISNVSATKEMQIVFNRDLQKYVSRNEMTKVCLKGENETLICTADSYPTNCANFNDKYCSDDKCRIINPHFGPDPFFVNCDDRMEGGGWTVIQRRIDGSVDFYRDWTEYKNGFGDIDGEFFIGLDKLNALTTTLKPVELLIQLQDFNNTQKYAKYDEFDVANETEKYKLVKVGKYSGNAGDCFSQHQGYYFSTKDRDNDATNNTCSTYLKGAWWYGDCSWCNLNGNYTTANLEPKKFGIFWCLFHGDKFSLKSVQMSIRPKRI